MINSFIRCFVGLAILGCMASCNEREVYYKFSPISENEWSKEQEICFLLDSVPFNTNSNYAVSLEIVHNINYKYKNLFLYLDYSQQDSILYTDTVECILVDDYGRWSGSGNGATRQLSVPYKTNLKIDTALHNEICVRHTMQDLTLKGIEKIGLKIY